MTEEQHREVKRVHEEALAMVQRQKVPKVPLPCDIERAGTMRMPGFEPKKRKMNGNSALEKSFNKEMRDQLDCEIARMFYTGGLPFHLARNPYFVNSYALAANNNITGYVPPSYNSLRTTLLVRERDHVETLLKSIKGKWKSLGVSIVSDGWTDAQRRPLINFMAASEAGLVFLKAVNCEKEVKDKFFIANLIDDAITEVGVQNVVQVITDNAPVCRAAGLLVEAKYRHIFWTPCVVHTLNLALKNICAVKNTERNEITYSACHWITEVAGEAHAIKTFIMNHAMRLAIFNVYSPLKLLAVADTRFASVIVMLRRFQAIKVQLGNMVVSGEWSTYKEDDIVKANKVRMTILDDAWWDKVDYILRFTAPIYEMLRETDTDQPNLHLVYDKWDTMIGAVKQAIYTHERRMEAESSPFFQVVYEILVDRWNKSSTPLHCLAHSLNPKFYSDKWLDENPTRVAPHKDVEISAQREKCLQKFFPEIEDRMKANSEFANFSLALDSFGSYDSIYGRNSMEPIEWWAVYGANAPMLMAIALKILGQPCSSSCCERNWSTYSFINSMRRNKITPQRAEDLVYVHSNLRLLSRTSEAYKVGPTRMWDIGGDTFDPLDGAGLLEIANLSLDEPDLEKEISEGSGITS